MTAPIRAALAEALKPCPFCGGAPVATDRASDVTPTGHIWFLTCFCGGYAARAHQMGDTEAEVIAAWNRRAAAALLREPPTDEAVAKALGCMWGVGIDESLEIFVSPRYVVEAVRSAALEVR